MWAAIHAALGLFKETVVDGRAARPGAAAVRKGPFEELSARNVVLPFLSDEEFALPLHLVPCYPLSGTFKLPSMSGCYFPAALPFVSH